MLEVLAILFFVLAGIAFAFATSGRPHTAHAIPVGLLLLTLALLCAVGLDGVSFSDAGK